MPFARACRRESPISRSASATLTSRAEEFQRRPGPVVPGIIDIGGDNRRARCGDLRQISSAMPLLKSEKISASRTPALSAQPLTNACAAVLACVSIPPRSKIRTPAVQQSRYRAQGERDIGDRSLLERPAELFGRQSGQPDGAPHYGYYLRKRRFCLRSRLTAPDGLLDSRGGTEVCSASNLSFESSAPISDDRMIT